jgi:hypothetical protein
MSTPHAARHFSVRVSTVRYWVARAALSQREG